jgi:hypothetical protein
MFKRKKFFAFFKQKFMGFLVNFNIAKDNWYDREFPISRNFDILVFTTGSPWSTYVWDRFSLRLSLVRRSNFYLISGSLFTIRIIF